MENNAVDYGCVDCGSSFSDYNHFDRHVNIPHDYECGDCFSKFITWDELLLHKAAICNPHLFDCNSF